MFKLLQVLLRILTKTPTRGRLPPAPAKTPPSAVKPDVLKNVRERFPPDRVCATGQCPPPTPQLNSQQAANFKRFVGKFKKGTETTITEGPAGGKIFRAEVPGKVPGSKAIYEKQLDAAGTTTGYTKTTYAPDGSIVHVKLKF